MQFLFPHRGDEEGVQMRLKVPHPFRCAKAMPTDRVINEGKQHRAQVVCRHVQLLSSLPSILISSDLWYDILLASSDLSNFDVLAVTRQPAIRT